MIFESRKAENANTQSKIEQKLLLFSTCDQNKNIVNAHIIKIIKRIQTTF